MGCFFCTFDYDLEVSESFGELKVKEKFVEGGEAKFFHVHVI
jgi:hypothetical protein